MNDDTLMPVGDGLAGLAPSADKAAKSLAGLSVVADALSVKIRSTLSSAFSDFSSMLAKATAAFGGFQPGAGPSLDTSGPSAAFATLGNALAQTTIIFAPLGAALAPLSNALAATGTAFGALTGTMASLGNLGLSVLAGAFKGIDNALGSGASLIGSALSKIDLALGGFRDAIMETKFGRAVAGWASQLAEATGPALAAFGSSIASLGEAFAGLLGSLQAVAAGITGMVGAFSPSTVMVMNQAMNELNATIGMALQPVASALAEVFRDVAAVLSPVMEILGPILGELAGTIGQILVPIVEVLATILEVLAPIFEAIAEILKPLAEVMKVFGTLLSAIFKALAPVFKILAEPIKLLAKLFGELVQAMKPVIQFLASLFGIDLDFDKKPGRTANAAPQQFGIKGLEQIGKDIQIAAAQAGGVGKEPVDDLLGVTKEIRDVVKDYKKAKEGSKDTVMSLIFGPIYNPTVGGLAAGFMPKDGDGVNREMGQH